MTTKNLMAAIALAALVGLGLRLAGQVQTDVPPPVPGAKPVAVERITIHGSALEGNLEANAGGVRVRGGGKVDITWKDGRLTASTGISVSTPAVGEPRRCRSGDLQPLSNERTDMQVPGRPVDRDPGAQVGDGAVRALNDVAPRLFRQ